MTDSLRDKEKRVFAFVRKQIIHQGVAPTLREINEMTGDTSPRSASLVIERLIEAGLLKKSGRKYRLATLGKDATGSVSTVRVPLVGSIACGAPMLAEQNIEGYVAVSSALAKKGATYFLLRATGTSMNRAGINEGDVLLVRQQNSAQNGDKVVALVDDEATVKCFERTAQVVILRPKSSDTKHKPIVLTENCQIQGVVVAVLPPDIH